jgi:hypothetical protein
MLEMTPGAMTAPDDEALPASLTAQLMLRRTENWARWLRRHWSEITILDAVCSLEWVVGRPRLHAQVCVTLGHILPADVRVEFLPAEALSDGNRLVRGRAMFSVAVQQNGRYWFAVNAPADPNDDQREWVVRISPSRAEVAAGIAPVLRSLDVVPAGASRHSIGQRHTA